MIVDNLPCIKCPTIITAKTIPTVAFLVALNVIAFDDSGSIQTNV